MFGAPRRSMARAQKAQTGIVRTRPAPIGGWNARDALANMPPTDAPIMVNWWPMPTQIVVRNGYANYATGLPGQVNTLMNYRGNTGSQNFYAASGAGIYDVTAGGAVGAAVVAGQTSDKYDWVNFTTTAGTRYLYAVNGADSPQLWSGAAWQAVTAASAPIAITGLTFATTGLSLVTSCQSRLFFGRGGTLEIYYLPVGAVGGAAALFDLRPVFKRGGVLAALNTWSVDTGTGLLDRLVAMSDQGEIVIYQGTDPSSASTWSLVGVYYVGGAIGGSRSLAKYGGDLLVQCQYGLIPLSALLQSKVVNQSEAITDKILSAISAAFTAGKSLFGWQIHICPELNMVLLNVPTSGSTWVQYVMNSITGAWTQFSGWNSACWCLWNDDPYFGGNTVVGKAWGVEADNGIAIVTDLECAFDTMDEPGMLKQWTMVRPILATDGSPGIAYGINVDFDQSALSGVPSFSASPGGIWDSALWDGGTWGGGLQISKNWQFASGLGTWGALRLSTSTNGCQLQLSAIDYLFENGGVL
jgi:hypothetical protein